MQLYAGQKLHRRSGRWGQRHGEQPHGGLVRWRLLISINIAQQLTLETPSFQTKNIHVNIYIFWESDIDPQKLK